MSLDARCSCVFLAHLIALTVVVATAGCSCVFLAHLIALTVVVATAGCSFDCRPLHCRLDIQQYRTRMLRFTTVGL